MTRPSSKPREVGSFQLAAWSGRLGDLLGDRSVGAAFDFRRNRGHPRVCRTLRRGVDRCLERAQSSGGGILSHYEDDFEMASPLIVEVAGEPSGVLHGKDKVGAYWEKALQRNRQSPGFEKLGVFVGTQSWPSTIATRKVGSR